MNEDTVVRSSSMNTKRFSPTTTRGGRTFDRSRSQCLAQSRLRRTGRCARRAAKPERPPAWARLRRREDDLRCTRQPGTAWVKMMVNPRPSRCSARHVEGADRCPNSLALEPWTLGSKSVNAGTHWKQSFGGSRIRRRLARDLAQIMRRRASRRWVRPEIVMRRRTALPVFGGC